ncbi:SwmB domain-containing protein [Azohydromonas aeria]|uniref:SwmB domain-containing protein n=1 Tax=Azohydromonas aeria TaxID=2590212 RepID=UPI0012F9019F|nr:SwmB domain-containing protein [Azohydromonas aeria]
MATRYKWFPGHYVLLYNVNLPDQWNDGGLTRHLEQIKDIPNLIGIQKRYTWRFLEATKDSYDFSDIVTDLATCERYGKKLRAFLTIKGFNGGRGAPDYLRPGNAGYEAGFGPGVYNWLQIEQPAGSGNFVPRNEHPALWLNPVRDRLKKLVQRMGQAIDSHPALSVVDLNETSWGPVPAGTAAGDDAVSRQRKMALAYREVHAQAKVSFPTTIFCHFLNFPNNAGFSVINDAESGLPAEMLVTGTAIGGPDNWLDDFGLERPPSVYPPLPGVFWHYKNARGLTAISPSNQPGNYETKSHEDYTNTDENGKPARIVAPDITIEKMYLRCSTAGVTFRGMFKEGLHATHVNWSARTDAVPTATPWVPWNEIRNFFRNKWNTPGPDYQNMTPGVVTAVPAALEDGAPQPPPAPTLRLASDTGQAGDDLYTNSAALAVDGLVAGAVVQYARDVFSGWSATPPTPLPGENTVIARQLLQGIPSEPSNILTFQYDRDAPVLVRATINNDILRIYYRDAVPFADAAGFIPDRSAYSVTIGGAPVVVDGRSVLVVLRAVELNLRTPALAGSEVRVSYSPPTSGTLRFQDAAGNFAPAFTNQAVNNVTGVPAPTKTVAITQIGGVTPGGYTPDGAPLLQGTISGVLANYEEVEVRRVFTQVDPDTGVSTTSYVLAGIADVVGTTWSYRDTDRGDRFFAWAARVRNGELFGPFSETVGVTVDTKPPQVPVLGSGKAVYRVGEAVTIFGGWGAGAGEKIVVYVNGGQYTTANGLQITGRNWTLPLGPQPVGRYNLGAIVTDLAGNTAAVEEPTFFDVVGEPSINELRLALARVRV